jgi:hypothetical protein
MAADGQQPSTAEADARTAAYTSSGAPSGSGLFSRYESSPAIAMSAASGATASATATPTATSPRGESDLWHLVSEPTAAAPQATERRSFDPVTIFLTVLVAIVIVALILGVLFSIGPILTGLGR